MGMTALHLTGERLMLERRWCGLSQLQLARSLGVHPRTLASWEQTGQPIPVGLVERIAAALWIARQRQAQRDRERLTRLSSIHHTRSIQP